MPQLEDTLVTLLDPDADRRAAVASVLSPFVKRVVPRAQLDQLMANWPLVGIVLVHDSGSLVRDFRAEMLSRGRWRSHVVFAEAPAASAVVDAITAGAIDYLAWPISEDEVLRRMQLWPARSGRAGIRHLRKNRACKRIATLSPRESQILKLMAQGKKGSEIADLLALSARTIEVHRGNIFKKLNVRHGVAALRMAIEAGL